MSNAAAEAFVWIMMLGLMLNVAIGAYYVVGVAIRWCWQRAGGQHPYPTIVCAAAIMYTYDNLTFVAGFAALVLFAVSNGPAKLKECYANNGAALMSHIRAMPIMMGLTIMGLLIMGRNPSCEAGDTALWNGNGAHLSQHPLDEYSITHVMHGVVVYWLATPRMGRAGGMLIACAWACGWELLENSQVVINTYRHDAIHRGYNGDSVTNSIGDIICCGAGWNIADRIGQYYSLLLFIASECLLLWVWKDSLMNNVVALCKHSHFLTIGVFAAGWMFKMWAENTIYDYICKRTKRRVSDNGAGIEEPWHL